MAIEIVLITGCSQGIGEATALRLATDSQHRYKVYATVLNLETDQADITFKAKDALNKTLFVRELDVTKQDTIDRLIAEIIEKEGRIDVLGMYMM